MKKRYFFLKLVFVCFVGVSMVYSQMQSNLPSSTTSNNKKTLKEISKSFDDYWAAYNIKGGYYFENGVKKKALGWKQFKRAQYYWEQRVNPQTGEFPTTTSIDEFNKSKFSLNKTVGKTSTASWSNLGTSSSTGGYAGIGRINCVAFHPSDPNTYWIGSPSGGIWKTTNNGTSWTCLNNNIPVLGVSDIAIPSDYVTSNTIYIATGDRDVAASLSALGSQMEADNHSIGVYKTTNGGTDWTATGLTLQASSKKVIGRLLLASDNTTLYASVYSQGTSGNGIYKSTNSGTNWNFIADSYSTYIIDMEFKPGNSNIIYASTKGPSYIHKTTDGGTTWLGSGVGQSYINAVFDGAAAPGRIELAVSPADPTVVYVLYSLNSRLKGIYKSTNSGASYSVVWDGTASNHNLLGYEVDASDADAGQGDYDLSIAVSPTDINTIFIGGVNTWYSTDGGTSWKIRTNWNNSGTTPNRYQNVHADKHFHGFQSGTVLFESNDGGIYRAVKTNNDWNDAGSDFVDKTNGLVINQIYRIGVSQSDVNKVLIGSQDNGCKLRNGSTWTDGSGGDGMECIIDPTDANYLYQTYTSGQIYRTTNGNAASYTEISPVTGGAGAWVTPYILDPNNSQIIYVGYDQVWKTTNRGTNWTSISSVLSSVEKLRSLAIAPSNTNVLYAADQTHMWKTTDGGATAWSSMILPAGTSSLSLTYISVKATDPNTVWITFGGYSSGNKVFQSTNGGTNWTNISGTLANVPVLCIVQNKRGTGNQLFIGTDLGVFAKDGASDWIYYNDGMPSVIVTELEFYYGATQAADRLRAGTFGRGLWETAIQEVLPVELTKFTAVPNNGKVKLDWITATEINNYGFEVERSADNKLWLKVGFERGNGNSNSPKYYSFVDHPIGGVKFYYRLKQIDFDGRYKFSDISEVALGNPSNFVVHQNYPNPFNPNTTIRYDLPIPGFVTIKLLDAIGREMKTLSANHELAGFHEIVFDGSQYASGVYYYSIQIGDLLQTKKMVLLK